MLLGGPALAQEAPATAPCTYPFNCPAIPPTTPPLTTTPIGGGVDSPATGEAPAPIGGGVDSPATGEAPVPAETPAAGGGTVIGGGGGGPSTVVHASPTRGAAGQLPFTGGEVTLIALAGVAAVGGGIVLTAAGRKRSTA